MPAFVHVPPRVCVASLVSSTQRSFIHPTIHSGRNGTFIRKIGVNTRKLIIALMFLFIFTVFVNNRFQPHLIYHPIPIEVVSFSWSRPLTQFRSVGPKVTERDRERERRAMRGIGARTTSGWNEEHGIMYETSLAIS